MDIPGVIKEYVPPKRRLINVFNDWHLGDQIFGIIYFNGIKDYLEANCIRVCYYMNPVYIPQVAEFVQTPKVSLYPLNFKPADAVNIWIATSFPTIGRQLMCTNFHVFLQRHFERMAGILGLPKIPEFLYKDPNLAVRYNALPTCLKNTEILVINARPQSGQYGYSQEEWTAAIRKLAERWRVVVTTAEPAVPAVLCTSDFGLSVKGIAALSTRVPIIIAVNSGPIVPLFNTTTMNNVTRIYSFDFSSKYGDHPKIKSVSQWSEVWGDLPTVTAGLTTQ